MYRGHSSPTFPLMLMMSAAMWAAHAVNPDSPVAAQTLNGTYAVTFRVKAPSTLQSGSTVTCTARVEPRPGAQENGQKPYPAETAQGVGGDPRGGAALSYEIDAVNGTTLEAVRRQEGIAVPLPQVGATANVDMDVNF